MIIKIGDVAKKNPFFLYTYRRIHGIFSRLTDGKTLAINGAKTRTIPIKMKIMPRIMEDLPQSITY